MINTGLQAGAESIRVEKLFQRLAQLAPQAVETDRKSTRLNSSHQI